MEDPGEPSDRLPEVLATGSTDVASLFVSMSARHPDGSDREYLEWHGLDHCPEQYRLPGLRHALRIVSTPDCRKERLAVGPGYDPVDHVMTYFFAEDADLRAFAALGAALGRGGRMPVRLPSVELGAYGVSGKAAAPRVGVGADVIPWRPATGVYVIIEDASGSVTEHGAFPASLLVEVPGVSGVWWHDGRVAAPPFDADRRGLRLVYCYLDDHPVEVAHRLRRPLTRWWADSGVRPLLAAPFHTVAAPDWGRHLP